MTNLFAKSDPRITLKQHIKDGLAVWKNLKKCFPMAPFCSKKENYWELLEIAIIMHDLGKAHNAFQKVLCGEDNDWFGQRHELFSLPFVNALEQPDEDKLLISRIVAAHHRTYSFLENFIDKNYDEDSVEFEEEFQRVDQVGAKQIVNSFIDNLFDENLFIEPVHPNSVIVPYKEEVKTFKRGRTDKLELQHTMLLFMGAFHHCDHLSSAFVTEFPVLEDKCFTFLDQLESSLLNKNKSFYLHQKKAANIKGNVILTAPTGSGKTETSILWLRNQLNQTGQGRVFYVLPFTASINAMYERLSHPQKGFGNDVVGMLHGKLGAYLYESFFEDSGNLIDTKSKIKEIKQTFKNLETPVKVITPFQLLKHLFGLKGFEKGIFEWVGGYFIFDEIHAYDPEVTAQIIVLLEFLSQKMEANLFVMTATLPSFLKDRIGEAIGSYKEIKAERALYDSFMRHRVFLLEGKIIDSLNKINEDLDNGKSVLVVCNTVDQAREVYNEIDSISDKLLIHGRFTAQDRAKIERDLHNNSPQLLVGTQAIEVSLDIDYDIIYTEPAPLDALIQRFGRVNRKQKKNPCPCIVFQDRNERDEFIYPEEVITATLKVLKDIQSKNKGLIKEADLQIYIDEVYPEYNEDEQSKFDKIYALLTWSVNTLIPFEHSKDKEEDFYRQFDGIKVLPAFYESEYQSRLKRFDFIGAEQLKVSIRKSWFARLSQDSLIHKCQYLVYKSSSGEKDITKAYYRIDKWYRPEIGLNLYKDEAPKYLSNEDEIIS